MSQRIRLHVSEWGDLAAPPLVLTHGAFDHGRGIDLLAPLLADDYRVIAVDQRGHGDSEWAGSYGWLNDLLDLATVIRDLGTPVFLLGHSKGGGQALDVANMFPSLVRRVISLDGFGPPEDGYEVDGRPPDEGKVPELFALLLAGSRHEHIEVVGLLPGRGLDGGGAEPADRPFDASMGDTLLELADRSADTTLATDPLVQLCLSDLRPVDYVAFFAATERMLVLGEEGDDRPPWWREARNSERSSPGPSDPAAMVAALANR